MTSGKYTGELLSLKAGVFLQMGNPTQAPNYYNQAEQLEYRSPGMLQNRGTIYYARGDYANALRDFLDAYDMSATDGKLLMNIALSYKAPGNDNQAQRFYEMALQSGEQFPEPVLRAFR